MQKLRIYRGHVVLCLRSTNFKHVVMVVVQLSTRKRDIMAFSGFVYEDDTVRLLYLTLISDATAKTGTWRGMHTLEEACCVIVKVDEPGNFALLPSLHK